MKYIECHAVLNTETEKAFALEVDNGRWGRGGDSHAWFPKSQCTIYHDEQFVQEELMVILVPFWLARNKVPNYEFARLEGFVRVIDLPKGGQA